MQHEQIITGRLQNILDTKNRKGHINQVWICLEQQTATTYVTAGIQTQ